MKNYLICTGREFRSVQGIECFDGDHTFGELYQHRIALFAALCRKRPHAWKSRNHHEGGAPMPSGFFIAGISCKPGEQISYHVPLGYWDKFNCEKLPFAPKWDGHTSEDVLERLGRI